MWRFKTEKEFEAEFGKNWRKTIHYSWPVAGDMDYLFGQTINPDKIDSFTGMPKLGLVCTIKMYGIGKRGNDTNWNISKDMIKFEEGLEVTKYEIY